MRTTVSLWPACGPSFETLGAKEKRQESGTSVSGKQIAYEFIRPGSGAADVQPVILAVAYAMTFRWASVPRRTDWRVSN